MLRRFLASIVAITAACSGPSAQPDPNDAATDSLSITCQDARAMAYAPNLTVAGKQGMKVVLISGAPVPPARGTNTWKIRVLDPSGNQAQNTTVVVKPFMPDHGHGTNVQPTVTGNSDGTFDIAPLYLFMPGLWQVTFDIKSATATDSVVFAFCVAG